MTLSLCPVCEYDLRGLPEKHCCPECGFAYDAHTRVWRSPFRTPVGMCTWIVLGILAAGLAARASNTVWGPLQDLRQNTLAGAALALGVATAVWISIKGRQRPFVAVMKMGVVVRTAGGQVRSLRWREIARLESDGAARRPTVMLHLAGSMPIDVSYMVRDDPADFCRRLIAHVPPRTTHR